VLVGRWRLIYCFHRPCDLSLTGGRCTSCDRDQRGDHWVGDVTVSVPSEWSDSGVRFLILDVNPVQARDRFSSSSVFKT